MNNYFSIHGDAWVLLGAILLGIGWGCQSDEGEEDKEIEPETVRAAVYYEGDRGRQTVQNGDTLFLQLGDTFSLHIDSVSGTSFYVQPAVAVIESRDDRYTCVANISSLAAAMLFWDGTASSMTFFMQMSPLVVNYYITETDYDIQVDNPVLAESIRETLQNRYTLDFSYMELTYETARCGSLTLKNPATGETTKGTFTDEDSLIKWTDGEEEYRFQISYYGELGIEDYRIIQDLTEVFQTQYPEETIQSVRVVTSLLKEE